MEDHVHDHVHSASCLLISTAILAGTAVTTNILRSLIRYSLSPSIVSFCLLDFLCGLELCVCGFELGVVLDIYDIPVYSGFLWIVLIWQAISWGDATANPYSHLLRWQAGLQGISHTLIRICAGAAGALASLLILAPVWMMELSHFHQGRAEKSATGHCGDDLQVSLTEGVVVELVGTLFCLLSGSILSDVPKLRNHPLLVTILDNAVGVALVIAAFDLTGGYFNPALAVGIKLGCGQGGHLQHLAVYWIGPCIGAFLAGPVYSKIKGVFVKSGEKEEESKTKPEEKSSSKKEDESKKEK